VHLGGGGETDLGWNLCIYDQSVIDLNMVVRF